jgi:uncharacterized protein
MVLAHYVISLRPDDPAWLRTLDDSVDGRAAPLFCLLLGVGATILAGRGASDVSLVRRGAALFLLGAALWPLVDRVYLILPHYGLLLACVPALRRLPTRALLPAAAGAFIAPSLLTATSVSTTLRTERQPDAYEDLLEVGDVLWHLGWRGGYPLAGWVGFALVGLWVARLPLRRRSTAWWLIGGGALVAVTQPLVDALARRAGPGRAAVFLDASAHSNHTAWYVLASATAVATVGLCLLAAPVLRPLAGLGRSALTAYVAHLGLGVWVVWPWLDDELPPLVSQVAVALVVVGTMAVLAQLWLRRFGRGPLEAVLRWVAP